MLTPYFKKGKIQARIHPSKLLDAVDGYSRSLPADESLQLVSDYYNAEFAKTLLEAGQYNDVDDELLEWSHDEEPHAVGAGYFLYAEKIDWDVGSLFANIYPERGYLTEHLFWDAEEHLIGDNDPDNWVVQLEGLCFQKEVIEMMLPTNDLAKSANPITISSKHRVMGRPTKWNWEGAMAHMVSIAQHPDGLPEGDGAQARIEEMITHWFFSESGDSPSNSQIRTRARAIMQSVKRGQ